MSNPHSQTLLHIPPLTESPANTGVERSDLSVPLRSTSPPTMSATEPSVIASVGPTTARSLRGQTSKSFAAKNKDSSTVILGSSANPILAPTDFECYVRIGTSAGETARQARTRHNENETQVTNFITTLERNAAAQDRVHRELMDELLLLIQEVRAARVHESEDCTILSDSPASLEKFVENPVIKQLHSALVEDRERITELVHDMRTVERQISDRIAVAQTLPFIPQVPRPVSLLPTHALEDPVLPAAKRFKTSGQQFADVFYGPVDSDGIPRDIANAAMSLIPDLQPDDVFSAMYASENPLLKGQAAIPAGKSVRAGAGFRGRQRVPPTRSPLDIIRGVGKSARRR